MAFCLIVCLLFHHKQSDIRYKASLMCVCPQMSQIGLNFASEEEAKRFKSAANDLLLRRGRKTGKYNDSMTVSLLVSLFWKNHYRLVFI